MKGFDQFFFQKYVPPDEELGAVLHRHVFCIIPQLSVLAASVIIPVFFFFQSQLLQNILSPEIIGLYGLSLYIWMIYALFDWYCNVWIVTNESVVDLHWSLFRSKIDSVKFENIEGMGVEQNGIVDTLFRRGTIVIHKI